MSLVGDPLPGGGTADGYKLLLAELSRLLTPMGDRKEYDFRLFERT